ncbi:GNAT family N-acetyltransferase [Peribacillus kribbensis]|uniref:GNAT family N-acetyltransferase n=1 Tax=Peribacillus kribbensis TaxID=356658 RepID=UPI000404DE46|nr:GNAT family N-acetyltransferase [Peribacillus kribbensis]
MGVVLETERLLLRPFLLEDAVQVQRMAGEREIYETTLGMPHPYPLEAAVNWIRSHEKWIQTRKAFPFAVELKKEKILAGAMTLRIEPGHNRGELAYWIGKEFWGRGYATEAALQVAEFGFREQGLQRIWGMAMSDNYASQKVMKKIGMKYEGRLRKHILKDGRYYDLSVYGLLREQFKQHRS